MGNTLTNLAGGVIEIGKSEFLLYLVIAFVIAVLFYTLRTIGLYSLAKKQNVKNIFLVFIPFAWIYIACKLIKNERFFNKPYQNLALIFCILFTVTGVLNLVYQILLYFPLFQYLVIDNQVAKLVLDETVSIVGLKEYFEGAGIFIDENYLPYGNALDLVNKALEIIGSVSGILDLASTIITVFLYIAIFKTYWPQHYTLVSLICIFTNLFPVFIFVIRKKEPVNFNDYMRSRYNSYANQYQNPYQNPYSNNYSNGQGDNGNYNGYNNYNPNYNTQRPDAPFNDFADENSKQPEKPFEDFDKHE